MTVEPEHAVNEVGTTHTITVTFDELELPEIPIPPTLDLSTEDLVALEARTEELEVEALEEEGPFVLFEVISGPNSGTRSDEDGDCVPGCDSPPDPGTIEWTYQSNGIPGTDTIRVCMLDGAPDLDTLLLELDALIELINELSEDPDIDLEDFIEAVNEDLGSDFVDAEDLFCDEVTKEWVRAGLDRQQPNIGAALGGFIGGPPPSPYAAPAATVVVPDTGIRPPNTGDAGLR